MTEKRGGILIVKVRLESTTLQQLKAKLESMGCVEVEFNYISSKLSVKYDGSRESEDGVRAIMREFGQGHSERHSK